MRISTAFPSKYLKAINSKVKQVNVIMSHVTMGTIGDDARPVSYFQRKEKGLVLNKTNGNAIGNGFGDDTEEWRGSEIALFETMVDFPGKTMAAIRCRVPPCKADPTAAEIDDEISF
jgi:hypothetical protein